MSLSLLEPLPLASWFSDRLQKETVTFESDCLFDSERLITLHNAFGTQKNADFR